MWHGNTIYFTSDRGPEHKLNLYSYDLSSKQIEQLTKFTEFDLMWPSSDRMPSFSKMQAICTPSISPARNPGKADHLSARRE